ncbi:hypothetical protein GE09DRAFT_1294778, partial [Coniochaeta sp. 2T2.1]
MTRPGPSRKRLTPESPYWIPGLDSGEELGNPTLRGCVTSRSPFAPAAEQLTLSTVIRTNVTIFLRTLVYFGHFVDCYGTYWDAVSEAMGWDVSACNTISRYYVRGRLEYIEHNNSFTLFGNENRASNLICRLIDDYRLLTRNNGRTRSHVVLTQARKDYIDQTRLTWGRYVREQAAELMETPYSPILPIIPEDNDWLSTQAASARTEYRRVASNNLTLSFRELFDLSFRAPRRSAEMDVPSQSPRWRETTPDNNAEASQVHRSLTALLANFNIVASRLGFHSPAPPSHPAALPLQVRPPDLPQRTALASPHSDLTAVPKLSTLSALGY